MNIRQHRQMELAFDLGQDFEPAVDAGAAKRGAAGAVGLVEAAFENERNAQAGRDFLQGAGRVHLQLFGLDHAGAGDEEETLVQSNIEPA